MGLSFEDSLKATKAVDNSFATKSVEPIAPVSMASIEDYSIATLDESSGMIEAYSGDEGSWFQDSKYKHYNIYSDDDISNVDNDKNINLNEKQFNITQEENSQYIPFEMPRYYDGYDLSKALITIHYERSDKKHSYAKPINVSYSDGNGYKENAKIRFGWLVDSKVTKVAGKIKFEIHARGNVVDENGVAVKNEDGEPLAYVWKTKHNGDLNVLQSICDEGEYNQVVDDETWMQTLIKDIAKNISDQIANSEINLDGYATTNYVDDKLTGYAKSESVESLSNSIGNINNELSNIRNEYATQEYVDAAVSNADISDKIDGKADVEHTHTLSDIEDYKEPDLSDYALKESLDDYALKSDVPSIEGLATETYVQEKIDAVDVSDQLADYALLDEVYLKDKVYTKDEVDELLGDVEVDLTDYYNKSEIDGKVSALSTDIKDNADDIQTVNSAITSINQTLEGIDTSPRVTYKATYGDVELDDGTTAEHMFTLWKNEGNGDEVQDRFQISGGGGGSSSNLKSFGIKYIEGYGTPIVATVNDKAIIKYEFVGEDSVGDTNLDGTASWKVGNRVVATEEVSTGINEFDLTEYVGVGDNKIMLTITHATGAIATKAWTVKVIDVRLESNFDDTRTNVANQPVNFTFTPYGGVDKTVHFLLDGKEISTKTSSSAAAGLSDSFSIPAQEHGTHLFEIYMTAAINGKTIESNHIVKDIIWYDDTSNVPVIGTVYQEFTARQYEATNITYTVYDPSTETTSVSLKATYVNEDGEIVEEYNSNLLLDSNTQVWQYKTDIVGEHTLTIICGETVKTLIVTIVELGINVSPITAGLAFDFNPVGYSNNDENRLWNNGSVAMTVSDNFDWVNGGYQIDENGDQCFCIKSGTSADISYELFGDDAKTNGKQFKLIFKTKNVADGDTTFLSCLSDNIGIEMKAHEATIYAETGSLHLPYAEEEIIEFEFNITPSSETPSMIMGYEDGVSTRPLVYDSTHNLQQYQGNRKTISLGSPDCDLYIYRFKVYNTSLSDRDILNNFIADARSAEEMIDRYDRNQIYKEGVLDPDYLAEVCPQLRIIKLEVPWFTNDKDDKVYSKNRQSIIECIYKGGDPVYDNWVAYDCVHSGQGTSSNNYGPAGRNLDLIIKPYKDYGNSPYIVLGDGTQVSKVALTRESIPVNYFNVKVNIASSENANNALMAKRYNAYNPYNRPFVREDESIIPYIKDTMEFQNCVIFVKESDPDLSTHREFNDNNWHFYAIGNIGDSKKTDSTRLTDQNDPYECILEVMDNTLPNSTMPTGKVDENGAPVYPILPSEWTVGNSAYDALHADTFDEAKSTDKENGLADTYGWRYIYEYDEDEDPDAETKNAEVKSYVENAWKEFYEFVVTSTDEEFKSHLGDYCVLDSVMYYYLFTLRYTMTDNHAKNSFWHYGKTGELDESNNPIRKFDLCFGYDFDTCLGIDNYGRMTYRYGYEEIDYVDGTQDWVWNAPQHVFFLRLRELFDAELSELYTELESAGAWSATGLINQFNDWQMQWPEEIWRLDTQRKYIRTYTESYIGGKAYPEFLVERANGRKKTQRAQFEKNQEKYMSSKFSGTVASADDVILRCSVPNTSLAVKPNFNMNLVPYSHIYLNVKYNTAPPVKVRAVPNQEYTIEYTDELADIIEIYSASCLKSIGDLSDCYLTNGTFANATKIRELKLGNDTEGYNNTNVMTLGLGSNELLNKLDIQNMSGLTHSLELSGLKNLEELYAFGSGVSGVVFADGGNIEIAELPDVGSLQMKNLVYLDDEGFEATSYNNLTKLIAENSQLDLIEIINNSSNLRQVRLVGIDWTLDNVALLERLYNLAGITNAGANTDQSVLSGKVFVNTIKQQELYNYQAAWPDLEISYANLVAQHKVTFLNHDDSILDTQYVVNGEFAVNPIGVTISMPVKESTVSHHYNFIDWDIDLETERVLTDMTVKAVYDEVVRQYTVRYMTKTPTGTTAIQTISADYGSYVEYDEETYGIPVYTNDEGQPTYTYYLFNGWDKSGFVDGDKDIIAQWSSFTYTGKGENDFIDDDADQYNDLANLTPVQIYALDKLIADGTVTLDGNTALDVLDTFSFTMGYDVDYTDIESQVIIGEKTTFDGTNKLPTGIKLFEEDKDFVIAIDYKISSDTAADGVLFQCYQGSTYNGFKFANSNGNPTFYWGGSTNSPTSFDCREMMVIRHIKGEKTIHIYNSNLGDMEISIDELDNANHVAFTNELVFGCAMPNATTYRNYGKGDIYWCKIWYTDLGESTCKKLANWTHEKLSFELCSKSEYFLADDTDDRLCNFALLGTHLLDRNMLYNNSNSNAGGWAASKLNAFLNTRMYNALPSQIKAIAKKVKVNSTSGGKSTEMSKPPAECYIFIPCAKEMNYQDGTYFPISEGTIISYIANDPISGRSENEMRMRRRDGATKAESYFLRSPTVAYEQYVGRVEYDGAVQPITQPNISNGVVIMMAF